MATLVQNQKRYHVGYPDDLSEPPEGYRFSFAKNMMLLTMIDQAGNEFYACPDGDHWNLTPKHRATLWDAIRTFGRLKIGSEYADTRTLIQIPA